MTGSAFRQRIGESGSQSTVSDARANRQHIVVSRHDPPAEGRAPVNWVVRAQPLIDRIRVSIQCWGRKIALQVILDPHVHYPSPLAQSRTERDHPEVGLSRAGESVFLPAR